MPGTGTDFQVSGIDTSDSLKTQTLQHVNVFPLGNVDCISKVPPKDPESELDCTREQSWV